MPTRSIKISSNKGGGYTSGYFYTGNLISKEELYHHGILGQKWGIRRFQNLDGTLTEEGKLRYKLNRSDAGKQLGFGKKHFFTVGIPTISDYLVDLEVERQNRVVDYKKKYDREFRIKRLPSSDLGKMKKHLGSLIKEMKDVETAAENFKKLRPDEKEVLERFVYDAGMGVDIRAAYTFVRAIVDSNKFE